MKQKNFPFAAIIGQDEMKLALILNVIDPKIGGVLLTGQQGTGKTTAVRAIRDILPQIEINEGCQFQCDLNGDNSEDWCDFCKQKVHNKIIHPINLVNLPLGATEEMLIGSLDIEKIIREGKRAIQPGLLAKAHRGILYIDEINLLQDHLIDVLLDVSASGINIIEREGISLNHPSSFILIGSMNPEEGELRPQISDRLGLEVQISAPKDPLIRARITQRVIEYNDNPEKFIASFNEEQKILRNKIQAAKIGIKAIQIPDFIYQFAADLILRLGLYSQRSDITFIRCARSHAAFQGNSEILKEDLLIASKLVFNQRIKRFNESMEEDFLLKSFEEFYEKLDH